MAAAQILVLSDEPEHLVAVRVHRPFEALRRRGAIAGYAILRHGAIVSEAGAPTAFDAIWVHRSMRAEHHALLAALDRPFAYDIDDNLLAAPGYRPAFPATDQAVVRLLLDRAASVSCATPRLAGLLAGGPDVAITPNLAFDAPRPRTPGPPRALVWASSDHPALTTSRDTILHAVRAHALRHGVRLVCIGAPPPPELEGTGVRIETAGLLPHDAYVDRLRALSPSILVCPLETDADPATQAFIDGKSDIKMIEALSHGLVGVFSRARPYLDSDLPHPMLCANTAEAWLCALDAAREACLHPAPPRPWPGARDASATGLVPWLAAIERARLPAPLSRDALHHATLAVQAEAARAPTRAGFDAAHYLATHPDVRAAVAAGTMPSAFEHYVAYGRAEGRAFARIVPWPRRSPGQEC